MEINKRIEEARKVMKKYKVDALMIILKVENIYQVSQAQLGC